MKYISPEHFFILKKLHARCPHNFCCFCYFGIFLNINFNEVHILVEFINYLAQQIIECLIRYYRKVRVNTYTYQRYKKQ